MSNKIRQIIDWYSQFDNETIVIETESNKYNINISKASIGHLLGLHYIDRNPRSMHGFKLLKKIEYLNDEEVYNLIKRNNRKMIKSVMERVNYFKSFLENLENAVICEKSNLNTKIDSQHFIIQEKDNKYLHLGLLTLEEGNLMIEFNVLNKATFETFFVRKDNSYVNDLQFEEIKSIKKYEINLDVEIPFSFDNLKNAELVYEWFKNRQEAESEMDNEDDVGISL